MQTDLVLAIQPDLAQAVLLRDALLEQVDGEVVVVETTEAALSVIDKRVPKVILLHALMPVREEDYLAAYLRTLVNTGHVQVIAIPHLEPPSAPVPPKRSLFGALKLGKATGPGSGWVAIPGRSQRMSPPISHTQTKSRN